MWQLITVLSSHFKVLFLLLLVLKGKGVHVMFRKKAGRKSQPIMSGRFNLFLGLDKHAEKGFPVQSQDESREGWYIL